jgi:hypothetical protein
MKDLIAEYKESQKSRFSIAEAKMNSKQVIQLTMQLC